MFVSLLQNEWMKAYHRNKFIIFSSVMVGLLLLGAGATLFFNNYDFGEDAVPVPAVGSLEFATGAVDTLFVFVLVFSTVMVVSGVVSEYKNGTMKQLLIRPVSRAQILLSKWVMVYIASFAVLIALSFLSWIVGAILFENNTTFGESLSTLTQLVLYRMPMLFFYQAMALCLAILTRSTAISLSAVIVLHFTGNVLMLFVQRFEWSKFLIIPNLNLQYYSENELIQYAGGPLIEGMTLGFSLTMIALYSVALLVAAHLVFHKKDVLS
ncbi:ABC transporter permease [Alkalicoccobacillus porphyridii]|uniref:ABC transporter permease subunit n=1 Tax=Alkalicoccobacillus porphyridii TaxID=2597270 RepID=A0A554A4I5_9BACI|nr:ABC transporter permease [Alkalicoccobacillus porphyridii]TSB48592.1 ABC transporter permease subunit [Alkalicoccobacillus porphyridii]